MKPINYEMLAQLLMGGAGPQPAGFGGSKKVPVIGLDGQQVGEVSSSATSLGASKITGVPMQMSIQGGVKTWVPAPRR